MSDRAKPPGPTNALVLAANAGAKDRQRALNEVVQRALKDYVGRLATPTLLVAAEREVREALDDAIRAGTYVLPDGLELDRVELGPNMRLQVLFKKAAVEPDFLTQLLAATEPVIDISFSQTPTMTPSAAATDEVSYTAYARVSPVRTSDGWSILTFGGPVEINLPSLGERAGVSELITGTAIAPQDPPRAELKSRFDAVAAELVYEDENEEEDLT